MSMDGTKAVTLTGPTEFEPAGEVELHPGPKDLQESDLKEYAERTGVTVIKLKGLQKRAIMGELVQRLGALRVGSSMLIESEEMIRDGITICDQLLKEYAHEPILVGAIIKTRLGFVQEWGKTAKAHISSRKDAGIEDSDKTPQNIPFPPATAVQNNIQLNVVSNPDQPK